MKLRYPFISLVIIVIIFSITGCNSSSNRQYEVITIEGVAWAGNISTSFLGFGSVPESEENPEVKIIASPGDLIFGLEFNKGAEFYIRYEELSSRRISIEMEESAVVMDEYYLTFELTSDPETWEFFYNFLSPEGAPVLKYIEISDSLTEEHFKILERYKGQFWDIGLVLTDQKNLIYFDRLLSIFQPSWLMTETIPGSISEFAASFLMDLELLWIDGEALSQSDVLYYCPNLQQIIIADWLPEYNELVQLSSMKQLNSVTMLECQLTDLSNCEFPSSLTRLQFIGCDTLSDISGLRKIRKLRSLSLAGCGDVIDITSIANLPRLQFLSLPYNISQEEFDLVLQDQNALEVLEIIGCDSVTDLSILKDLYNLTAFIHYSEADIDYSQLIALNDPELIILNSELFEDAPEDIKALREALPETDIYPGGGLCLGSGWLLLILPFLFIMRYKGYLIRKIKKG